MNRLDNRGIGCEGANRGFGGVPENGFHAVCSGVELGRQHPSPLIFSLLPEALDGMEFGTLGRPEQTRHLVGDPPRCRRMPAPLIPQDPIQGVLRGGGHTPPERSGRSQSSSTVIPGTHARRSSVRWRRTPSRARTRPAQDLQVSPHATSGVDVAPAAAQHDGHPGRRCSPGAQQMTAPPPGPLGVSSAVWLNNVPDRELPLQGLFYRRWPGDLPCGPPGIAHQPLDRVVGERHPIRLREPLLDGLIPGTSLRRGHALAQRVLPRVGHVGDLAWRLRTRDQPGDASARIGRPPASHGMAAHPEQASHGAAGAGLLGLSQ